MERLGPFKRPAKAMQVAALWHVGWDRVGNRSVEASTDLMGAGVKE